ncbi:MAG: M20/M25/M40 family metallo-hydrolase [Chloroflexota bacterium]|nr:M20/M25/M40 family metallo-hydrolase [Chloroflexota bacterium]
MDRSQAERRVVAYLDDHDSEAVRLLQDLVHARSLARQEGTTSQPGTLVFGLRRELGLVGSIEVVEQTLGPASQNLIEVLAGSGDACFVIDAHTDTVPEGQPDRWFDGDPFSAAEGQVHYLGDRRIRIEVGRHQHEVTIRDRMARVWETKRTSRSLPIIYGRGTFDNKAAVASTVMAMRALGASGVKLAGTLVAAYVADEEESATGVEGVAVGPDCWLAERGFLSGPTDSDGFLTRTSGVALDGSYGYTPVVGHRGSCLLVLNVQGRAAHASTPFLGISAVEQMSRLLVALADDQSELIEQRLLPMMDAELLGPPTLAIGTTIAGGGVRRVVRQDGGLLVERGGTNAVPDWCEATIDMRYPPGRAYPSDLETFPDRIVGVVDSFLRERVSTDGWDFSLEVPGERGSGFPCALGRTREDAAAHPLVASALRVGSRVLGYQPDIETAPGGTDATVMIHQGRIPTLVELGAAGGLSHDYHEFVERDMIVAGAKVLALMAIDVLGLSEEL